MIGALIEAGALVDALDEYQQTPLQKAAGHNPGLVKIFIERGANVNLFDNNHWSPLYKAACFNNREAAIALCLAGAMPILGKNPLNAYWVDDEMN